MKKYIFVAVALLLTVSLSACGSAFSPDATLPSAEATEAAPTTTLPPETTVSPVSEAMVLPVPQEETQFAFLSGAGGWSTVMYLNSDGTFTGSFQDSEMGDRGEGYPNGSVYTCAFTGRFIEVAQISEYAYRMILSDVQLAQEPGEEWIKDEIRYVAATPYGIEEGTEFIFYLPDTPLDELPEDFLSWWPYRYEQSENAKDTLSCYGILNVATNYGFFYAE